MPEVKYILNTVYVEIRLERRRKNRQWLARQLGVTEYYLSSWLNHSKLPNFKNRKKINDIFLRGKGATFEKLWTCVSARTGEPITFDSEAYNYSRGRE